MVLVPFSGNLLRGSAGRQCRIDGCLFHLFILLLMLSLPLPCPGQKRSERAKAEEAANSGTKVGPKRTDRTAAESERVRIITKTEFVKVVVRSNKGYLSVVAVPAASVTLTPLTTGQKRAPTIKEIIKDEDGSLNLINLLPGRYKIAIEHKDYYPFSETIQVDPARPNTFVALNKMTSRYGAIRLGEVLPETKIFLDDQEQKISPENGGVVISRVPVGSHRLKVSKEGYIDLKKEFEVRPGEQTFVSARLDPAEVTINLKSLPGARVYVGSEEKAIIPPDGNISLSLAPGSYPIRLTKDGYQEWKKMLTLSLDNNPVSERIELIPVPNSAEAIWQPADGERKWFPQSSEWKFSGSGALIRGDKPVLFDTESSRDFNIYRDFQLEFDVVFTNGKGVAWVARAKDPDNYYLFEISCPQGGGPTFHFYVCQNGKLVWKDSQRIVEKLDRKGDSFHISFEARGGRFDTRLSIANAPSAAPHLIGIFQDNTLTYGGVGFRGRELSESLLKSFFVLPLSEGK
ncbi:MAG TPA: carboxypeptidase regulatory-like domain-containing protein [Blastocatellia bacterium]|nr:carboxypeptidase regulatory-like domain-containing protein [Blastocatellia bacterium]